MTPEERQTLVQLLLQLLEEIAPDEELVFQVSPEAGPGRSPEVSVSKREGTRRQEAGEVVNVYRVVTAQIQVATPRLETASPASHPPEPDKKNRP